MNPNYTNNQQYNNPNPHVNTAYNQQGYIQPGQPGYIQPGQPGYVQPTCQTGCTTTQPVHQPVHQTYTTTTHTNQTGFTKGENMKWVNPNGLSIPLITYSAACKKCHGTGTSHSTFTNTPVPCTRCYTRQGYCKKCYGTGTNYRKGKACTKCQAGKRMNNKSSSSSDSH